MDPTEPPSPSLSSLPPSEDAAAKATTKRYETLSTIRTKAIRGKGAWYWAHLEPFLAFSDNGVPKSVKLRCSLCNAVFSASNPSRTSTEHLKKGSCPNFISPSTTTAAVKPISSAPPLARKRPRGSSKSSVVSNPTPLLLTAPQQQQQPLVLSGGKEDLGALAMLEDSVKRLKSPKAAMVGPTLPKSQADAAAATLASWVIEAFGGVAFSALSRPKFDDFLRLVGMPEGAVSPRRFVGPVLDERFREASADSEAKIRDSAFFQVCCGGWKEVEWNVGGKENKFINFTVNLPNGTTVFHQVVLTTATVPAEYAESVMEDVVNRLNCGVRGRCVGIVADKFRSKALLNLEIQNELMVNLSCQVQGVSSLIKDFVRNLSLFENVISNCFNIANYFNKETRVRRIFHKYQIQEANIARLLYAPPGIEDAISNFDLGFSMLEDVMGAIGPLHLTVLDAGYKVLCTEDESAVELAELIQDGRFWNELDAVHAIVKLIKDMVREMEVERPLIGQCLPLWKELRSKIHDWCNKFSIEVGPLDKLLERRFKKNYHPAWSAAFILDPLYLIKDSSAKYLPPFKLLTAEQERDVDQLIRRLVSAEEAHIALMELMKWRTEGLDPLYAQAVQMKQPDRMTGKMKIANPQSSRLVWETCLSELKTLGKMAVRLIFLHATASCGLSSRPPVLQWANRHGRSWSVMERVEKMVFVAAHAKLERRDFSTENKDAKIFGEEEDDDADAPSV